MSKYVVLFRGINVGGNNKVAMKPLVTALEEAGFNDVKHYIQSGNIVLTSAKEPRQAVSEVVEQLCGISPAIMTISANEFHEIVANNPFRHHEGKLVHTFICQQSPTINLDKVAKYQLPSEEYTVVGRTLYLYAPDGLGRSKLAANMESCLGISSTSRNLNTINKLVSMLEQ